MQNNKMSLVRSLSALSHKSSELRAEFGLFFDVKLTACSYWVL